MSPTDRFNIFVESKLKKKPHSFFPLILPYIIIVVMLFYFAPVDHTSKIKKKFLAL